MSDDFSEDTNEMTDFRFWCQRVLPIVYDDNLSPHELLCKVVEYINKLIEGEQQLVTAKNDNYGSPLVANTAADMTDHNRVYVYTGSETGYTFGHWYFWNGSAWEDGGVYNAVAVQTDKTLSIPDMAADAKATGNAIADLKSALANDVYPYFYAPIEITIGAFKDSDITIDTSSTEKRARSEVLTPGEDTISFNVESGNIYNIYKSINGAVSYVATNLTGEYTFDTQENYIYRILIKTPNEDDYTVPPKVLYRSKKHDINSRLSGIDETIVNIQKKAEDDSLLENKYFISDFDNLFALDNNVFDSNTDISQIQNIQVTGNTSDLGVSDTYGIYSTTSQTAKKAFFLNNNADAILIGIIADKRLVAVFDYVDSSNYSCVVFNSSYGGKLRTVIIKDIVTGVETSRTIGKIVATKSFIIKKTTDYLKIINGYGQELTEKISHIKSNYLGFCFGVQDNCAVKYYSIMAMRDLTKYDIASLVSDGFNIDHGSPVLNYYYSKKANISASVNAERTETWQAAKLATEGDDSTAGEMQTYTNTFYENDNAFRIICDKTDGESSGGRYRTEIKLEQRDYSKYGKFLRMKYCADYYIDSELNKVNGGSDIIFQTHDYGSASQIGTDLSLAPPLALMVRFGKLYFSIAWNDKQPIESDDYEREYYYLCDCPYDEWFSVEIDFRQAYNKVYMPFTIVKINNIIMLATTEINSYYFAPQYEIPYYAKFGLYEQDWWFFKFPQGERREILVRNVKIIT